MEANRRILISADLEGVAGVVASDELHPGGGGYETACRLMTDEVNAAVRGIHEVDKTVEVVVTDSHGTFRNLLPERLDSTALLLRGRPRPLAMVQGVERADAVMFIGYHARAGQSGLLCHTFDDVVHDIRYNERSLGEAGLNAAVAAHFGAPLLLATGDEALVAEVAALDQKAAGVAVKRAVCAYAAESLHPAVACQRIEEAAGAAVRRWDGGLVRFPGPIDLQINLATPGQADRASIVPLLARLTPTTVQVQAEDAVTAYRWVRTIIALAAQRD